MSKKTETVKAPSQGFKVMTERDVKQRTVMQIIVKIISQILIYTFLIIMALIVLFPFYWMIISSLKTMTAYSQTGLTLETFFPKELAFENYALAFKTADLWQLFKNTAFVGIVSTLLSLVITVLSAFALARLEFKGKNVFFAGLLATMMIPGELFTITNYQTVSNFLGLTKFAKEYLVEYPKLQEIVLDMGNWKNTFVVLIVPFLVSVFYIYLLRNNFMQIPNELYLAAKVDGTSDLKYLWKVMIPLSLPTLISITIMKMMGAWNSYMWPLLVANDDAHKLVTNGLRGAGFNIDIKADAFVEVFDKAGLEALENYTTLVHYPAQMAAVVIVSIPLFLVFVFLRKYIMKGVSRSGIKG